MDLHGMFGTCTMLELTGVVNWAACSADYAILRPDDDHTYIIANTSNKDAETLVEYYGFKQLTEYKSSHNHRHRLVKTWGLPIPNPNSSEERVAFIDKQVYAKFFGKIAGYRSDWREHYANKIVGKATFLSNIEAGRTRF